MPRLPFPEEPRRDVSSGVPPAAPPATAPPAGPRPLTVSALALLIKTVFSEALPDRVRVVGEVSNLSDRTHWFFSLKDEAATIRCVCFASNARRIRTPVRNGMEVVVTGRVDFYEGQGHTQLYVDNIEPVGQGALELRLRQLMEKLRQLGYFDEQRKRPLPLVPRRVAVVTSRSAAALRDVIHTAQRRWPGCRLALYDVRVQGDGAAEQIAAAIATLSRHGKRLGIDAIILTRGGGSIEDLWAFNERAVADAIYRCDIPIVAAIGHETDTTIAELVADLRCATPTQAAMRLVPDAVALHHQVHQLQRRMALLTQRRLEHARHRVHAAARHTLFRAPQRLLLEARQRLARDAQRFALVLPRRLGPLRERLGRDHARLLAALRARSGPARRQLDALARRLAPLPQRRLDAARGALQLIARRLDAVGPRQVLERGYTYTLRPDGRLLRHPDQTTTGDLLTTVTAGGPVRSRVTDHPDAKHTDPAARRTPSSPRRAQSRRDEAPGLFE